MSLVVFRADGGPAIGAGHVMRCLALASSFSGSGWQVAFAVDAETRRSLPLLQRSGYRLLVLPDKVSEEPGALARQWPAGADVLVVDHYQRDAVFEYACRPWAKRIVVIDDLADRVHDADLLVDAGRQAEAYLRLVPAQCTVLTGPRYALVHPQFLKLRQQSLARRDGRAVKCILVSFGQVDSPNATLCALDALDDMRFDGDVNIAIGSAAPNLESLRKRTAGRIRLHIDTDNMPSLMVSADLAIGAGGGTAWERCCLGLPTVLLMIAENQRQIIARMVDAEAGIDAGKMDGDVTGKIAAAVRKLQVDKELRIRMALAASSTVDGCGTRRLFEALR